MSDEIANFLMRPSKAIIQIVSPLSTLGDVSNGLTALKLTSASDLPKTFTRWIDEEKISPPLDQGTCGSCWCMSTTSALSDRFMILKNISGLTLNPLVTVSCATGDGSSGCNGGLPSTAFTFMENKGAVDIHDDKSCQTWPEFCHGTATNPHPTNCDKLPPCTDFSNCNYLYKCIKGSTKSGVVVDSKGNVDVAQTIINMKTEIMNNGSIVCCYFIAYDFFCPQLNQEGWKSTNGIYINGNYEDEMKGRQRPQGMSGNWGDLMMEAGNPAGHAVTIVGWSEGDAGSKYGTVPYWIVKNSWGEQWNKGGFFKYAMYDEKKGINTKLGLDIPIKFKNQLFGGATVAMPDVSSGAPYGHETSSAKSKKTTGFVKKIGMYVGIGVAVIGLLFLLYKLYKYYTDNSNRRDYLPQPIKQPPAFENPPLNPYVSNPPKQHYVPSPDRSSGIGTLSDFEGASSMGSPSPAGNAYDNSGDMFSNNFRSNRVYSSPSSRSAGTSPINDEAFAFH